MHVVWAIVVATLLPAVAVAADPAPVTWKVVSVHDGDTFTAIDGDNVQHKVRLAGVDAPEIGQAFGTKARDGLAGMVKGKQVAVVVTGHDRYGRVLAKVQIEGDDLGRRLVADGLVWHYARFDKSPALAAAQRDARAARRGLWADREPMPPWDWRATEKGRKAVPAAGAGR